MAVRTTVAPPQHAVADDAYIAVYTRLRNVLGDQVAPKGRDIEQLAVKFAGGSVERSRELLQKYQEACRRTVTAEKRDLLNYTTPEYHAAAFLVATVEAGVKVQAVRKFVAAEVKMNVQDLDKICVDVVRKCGLADNEHVAKAFRMTAPGSADRGQRSEGKRKQVLPAPAGGGCNSDGSPATATATTRLGVPEGSSPLFRTPLQGDVPSELPEKRLDFSKAAPGSSGAQAGSAAGTAQLDPAAPLKTFVKRIRTLESPLYAEWCRQALA
eukprot:jgi/Undpi1/9761/HiC_scaffold_27.g12217.m1